MDLKEFITETIVQIQEGVQDAIKRRSSTDDAAGAINPVFFKRDHNPYNSTLRQMVEFDVALTVSDKSGREGKAGLKVWSLDLGGGASKSAERSTVSRIKFSIPIVPPTQEVHPASHEQ